MTNGNQGVGSRKIKAHVKPHGLRAPGDSRHKGYLEKKITHCPQEKQCPVAMGTTHHESQLDTHVIAIKTDPSDAGS